MSNMLLPPGFHDLTGASAKKHFFILKYCIEYFSNCAYDLVLPSTFQYQSPDTDENSIKIVDPINNKIMSVRNDITSQISRIWKKDGEQNLQKLCYYGDVIYRQNNHNHGDFSRKLTQAGIECIADASLARDLEVIKIMLGVLEGLKIKEFSMLMSFPNLFNNYCELLNISKEDKDELRTYLIDKNITAIKESRYRDITKYIIPGSFSVNDIKIDGLEKDISAIQELVNSCIDLFPTIDVIIDPFYIGQSSYHTDFMFSIIAHKLKRVIARGGSYNITNIQSAVGSSFYIEELSSV